MTILRLGVALWLASACATFGQGAETGQGIGAVLRTLDKVTGAVLDVEMAVGQTVAYGTLEVTLAECRFPTANPAGDAFAKLDIIETRGPEQIFDGWMVASSPALMALDHARYDVWVLRCLSTASEDG